jgi:hypothetical protein
VRERAPGGRRAKPSGGTPARAHTPPGLVSSAVCPANVDVIIMMMMMMIIIIILVMIMIIIIITKIIM